MPPLTLGFIISSITYFFLPGKFITLITSERYKQICFTKNEGYKNKMRDIAWCCIFQDIMKAGLAEFEDEFGNDWVKRERERERASIAYTGPKLVQV